MISIPGDVASSDAPAGSSQVTIPARGLSIAPPTQISTRW